MYFGTDKKENTYSVLLNMMITKGVMLNKFEFERNETIHRKKDTPWTPSRS